MHKTWGPTSVYSFAHFAVDLCCAYAMFSGCQISPVSFLLYNFCAFAMQMPMGLLADAANKNRAFALWGMLLVGMICLLPDFGHLGAVILGLGNGLFHIGGGLDVMNLSDRKAAPLGIFVSPGAYGIYLGTFWGNTDISCLPVLAILFLAIAGVLLICKPKSLPSNAAVVVPGRTAVPCAVLLFLVVMLRSYGGMAVSFPWKTGAWSFAAVSAVVFGKMLGGFVADRMGLFPASAWTLGLCAVVFLFSDHAVPGVLSLLLFNMTMPITLFVLSRVMSGTRGFSFGLLTFALFVGFLPSYFGAGSLSASGMVIVAILSMLLLLPGIRASNL